MQINSVTPHSANRVSSFKGLEQKTIELIRPIEIKDGRFTSFLKSAYENISSPEQRLLMGLTALFTQPFIDLNNKRVNEDTRLMSFSRTLAKIIVGTTVGVLVRKGSIHLAHKYTTMNRKRGGRRHVAVPAQKNSFLAPKIARRYSEDRRKEYVNSLGTLLGIGCMLFTNFLIDAPLTIVLTNIFYKAINKDGGANADN